ncbi:Uncharacterized protein Adt_32822 [Abeliophyllum distichum]|uniref:DUF1985 domain-containing protein n=1 Tax=Abeliophyllum distichum TaxID=126358 RepID=A0ABD1QUG8_9LAMI
MWEYLINPSQWCLGKVNASSNGKIFSIISARMSENQKRLFSDTCFGHFLQANELILNHQLIHQFLLREVKQSNDDEIWFNIGVSLDVVKLGCLLLLTSVMFTTAYKRSVEEWMMVMVDSEEMNTFAWGKKLFKFTLSSLKSCLKNKSLIIEGDSRPYIAYRVSGFLIAFQIWIYETLPVLEGKICTNVGNLCPRILNWTSRVQGNQNTKLNLAKDIFSRPALHTSSIKPTDAERSMDYATGFYGDSIGQRVEDSDDDSLYLCDVRSPRLKSGCQRTPTDESKKQVNVADDIMY